MASTRRTFDTLEELVKATYYTQRHEIPKAALEGLQKGFVQTLEGIPYDTIERAFVWWMRKYPSMPTAEDILAHIKISEAAVSVGEEHISKCMH
jgi:hypothetical protein